MTLVHGKRNGLDTGWRFPLGDLKLLRNYYEEEEVNNNSNNNNNNNNTSESANVKVQ